jgi:hypothetical protein
VSGEVPTWSSELKHAATARSLGERRASRAPACRLCEPFRVALDPSAKLSESLLGFGWWRFSTGLRLLNASNLGGMPERWKSENS